jgi:ATP diphosphatase
VPYTLEEAYEVADTIQRGEMAELRDELGDLLFQVVFYSQIAKEEGHFDFNDVVSGICDKMIRRHPHVFSDVSYHNDQQMRHAWELNKAQERAQHCASGQASHMDGVAQALPALIRAEKLQKRSARVGFDWPDASGALQKVGEELNEVHKAMDEADQEGLQDELGDLLFSIVNVIRLLGMDAEQTLRRANEKFERRFRAMESILKEQGADDMLSFSLEALDAVWEKVKQRESDR